MLRIYRAPDGRTYRYEEGRQPAGYVEAKARPTRSTPNKARKTPQDKGK